MNWFIIKVGRSLYTAQADWLRLKTKNKRELTYQGDDQVLEFIFGFHDQFSLLLPFAGVDLVIFFYQFQ